MSIERVSLELNRTGRVVESKSPLSAFLGRTYNFERLIATKFDSAVCLISRRIQRGEALEIGAARGEGMAATARVHAAPQRPGAHHRPTEDRSLAVLG